MDHFAKEKIMPNGEKTKIENPALTPSFSSKQRLSPYAKNKIMPLMRKKFKYRIVFKKVSICSIFNVNCIIRIAY